MSFLIKNSVRSVVSILLLFIPYIYCETTPQTPAGWTDGSGGSIGTLEELRWLSETPLAWDEYWELNASIDAGDTRSWNIEGVDTLGFNPIGDRPGSGLRDTVAFSGHFNGNGFEITHLYINLPNQEYVGFFGYVTSASIEQVRLTNCNITGMGRVGGLVGYLDGTDLYRSYVDGSITGTTAVGGLIGFVYGNQSLIAYSSTAGNVTGVNYVGGLIGEYTRGSLIGNRIALVEKCYADADVSATSRVGGLVGYSAARIKNSFASGDVDGDERVGGLIGHQEDAAELWYSYASGNISGDNYTGGLIGFKGPGTLLVESYHDAQSTGLDSLLGYGTPMNKGLTGSQFSQESSFLNWDFNDVWVMDTILAIDSSVRPYLRQQKYSTHISVDLSVTKVARIIGAGFYHPGDTVQLWIIDTKSGYRFTGWSVNINPLDTMQSITFVAPTQARYHLTAHFEEEWSFAGGDGTLESPYQIATLKQLEYLSNIASLWDSHFILTSSIDASETRYWNKNYGYAQGLNPIGDHNATGLREQTVFSGSFNGNGFVISNLYIYRPTENDIGMFGSISSADIRNVALKGISITGHISVGGLVGDISYSSTIANSYSTGSVNGSEKVGGLIGSATAPLSDQSLSVYHSYSSCRVEGVIKVGGFIGLNNAPVGKSFALGDVFALQSQGGGFIGQNNSPVTNSFSTGMVYTDWKGGGFIGDNYQGAVDKNYTTGCVSAMSYLGSFLGSGDVGIGTRNYYDSLLCTLPQVSGTIPTDGGMYGLTTSDFSKPIQMGYFNFDSIWTIKRIPEIDAVERPYLQWMDTITIYDVPYVEPVSSESLLSSSIDGGVSSGEGSSEALVSSGEAIGGILSSYESKVSSMSIPLSSNSISPLDAFSLSNKNGLNASLLRIEAGVLLFTPPEGMRYYSLYTLHGSVVMKRVIIQGRKITLDFKQSIGLYYIIFE